MATSIVDAINRDIAKREAAKKEAAKKRTVLKPKNNPFSGLTVSKDTGLLIKKELAAAKPPKNFSTRTTQSVDLSRIQNPTLIPIKRNNRIVGVRDTVNQQSVRGDFSPQQILNAEIKRKSARVFSQPQRVSVDNKALTNILNQRSGSSIKKNSFIKNADSRILLARNKIIASNPSMIQNTGQLSNLLQGSAELTVYTFLRQIARTTNSIKEMPATMAFLYRNPQTIKELPSLLKQEAKGYVRLWKTSPFEALILTGTELLLMKGTGAAFKGLGRLTTNAVTRLNPLFKGVVKTGKVITLNLGKGKKALVKVVAKMPKKTLAQQVALQGKTVNAISSQADRLLTFFKRSRVVRKPIPGEASFDSVTKRLLKKFDAGKITSKKELLRLDALIRKNGAKGILERSFFLDPSGMIRPSRLGVLPSGSTKKFLDYFSNITFKKPRPQILFFSNIKVSSFPNNTLFKSIAKKIKGGKSLTKNELAALLDFQNKGSGKFKPLGFVSGESEITLPPGTILKREKVLGVVLFDGKRIPIVKVSPYIPKGRVKLLLDKSKRLGLSKGEESSLKRLLKSNTGFNYASSYKAGKRYVSIKRLTGSGVVSLSKSRFSKGVSKASSKSVSRASKRVSKSSRAKPSKSVSKVSKAKSVRSNAMSKSLSKSGSRAGSSKKSLLIRRGSGRVSGRSTKLPSRLPSSVKRILRKKKRVSKKDKEILREYVKSSKPIYRPSLAAYIYGITSYTIPKNINPFTIRPILIKMRKQKIL